jgi:hypothetical protein
VLAVRTSLAGTGVEFVFEMGMNAEFPGARDGRAGTRRVREVQMCRFDDQPGGLRRFARGRTRMMSVHLTLATHRILGHRNCAFMVDD